MGEIDPIKAKGNEIADSVQHISDAEWRLPNDFNPFFLLGIQKPETDDSPSEQ